MAVALSYRRSFLEPWGLPHDCGACKGEQCADQRKQWGCEADSEEIQLWVPCQFCDQAPDGEECKTCNGRGYEPIYRCPRSMVSEEHWELVALHTHWPGTLPYAGGVYEQPAVYVGAMRIIDAAKARLEATIQSAQKSAAKGQGVTNGRD